MISILPSLGCFGILHRWSRQAKRKIHFFQDAYNCAIVLQKNSNSTSMVDFFQNIRTWEVQGNYGTRSFSVQYVVPSAKSSQAPENLVAKLEASLCLLYRLLEDAEAGTMHRICRNSVSTNQEFPIDDGDLTIEGEKKAKGSSSKFIRAFGAMCVDDVKSLTKDFIIPQCIQQSHVELSKTMQARVSSLDNDTIAHTIYESFSSLANNDFRTRQVKYNTKKASVEFKFQTARYKVFKLWLELKAQEEMHLKVDKLLSADFQMRKRKSTSNYSSRSSQMPLHDNSSIVLQPTVGLPHLHHEESVIEANHPNLIVQSTTVLLDTVSPSETHHSLQDLSFHQLTTTHKVEHWDSLIIAPSNYLKQCRVHSCLRICALDHIHEMSFSNPDFYSACGLVNHVHWRSIGCEGSELTDQFSASNLIRIPSSVLQRLDPLNILDVVRPGSAIYQRCQPYFEGELIKLFRFVLFHGKSPGIPDARRIIQNTDKFDVLGDDAVVVKATVARMMDFLWHLAQDIQMTAKRCPLGGHLSRDKQFGIPFRNAMGARSSLFHCVTLVVSQVFPYPCQGKRHRDTLNDSTYAYSQTVAGNWYLKDVGASRTISMSTMLHSIYNHKDHLSFDQMIELSFIASFYNSPVMVYTILSDFQYSMSEIHPWYQFADSSTRLLGEGVYQGGIEPRFQCSSNRKWNAFCTSYCDSNGLVVTTNKDVVDLRLSKILYIGYDLICWMNALKQCGVEHAQDLPIDVIHTKMESAVKRIQSSSGINGFDFGRFYLSQWLTIMIGLALPDSGIHLLQLNIPSKGTASFNHFLNPTMRDTASSNVKPVPVCDLDTMMKFASQALHLPIYLRTCMETLGCESTGHRELNIKDVFVKDTLLFEIEQQNGIALHKSMDRTYWEVTQKPSCMFRILNDESCKRIEG
eukprot:jgi/Psemu1/33797/gm1.33797_g